VYNHVDPGGHGGGAELKRGLSYVKKQTRAQMKNKAA
jgi:hypothetical protein